MFNLDATSRIGGSATRWEKISATLSTMNRRSKNSESIRTLTVRVPVSVWPDWAIFESSLWQIFLQKWPKYLLTFGAIMKTLLFKQKMLLLLFGKSLGTFYSNISSHLPVWIGSWCYKTYFGGNLDFSKVKKLKKVCSDVWTCIKRWKQVWPFWSKTILQNC